VAGRETSNDKGSQSLYLISGEVLDNLIRADSPVRFHKLHENGLVNLGDLPITGDRAFIRPYHDYGLVLFGSNLGAGEGVHLDIIDMRSVWEPRSLYYPLCDNCGVSVSGMHFLAREDKTLQILFNSSMQSDLDLETGLRRRVFQTMNLSTGEVKDSHRGDQRYVASYGMAGARATGTGDSTTLVRNHFDGTNEAVVARDMPLGWDVPAWFVENPLESIMRVIENQSIRVLTSAGFSRAGDPGTSRYYFYNKLDDNWHIHAFDGNGSWAIRGFGEWVVTEEVHRIPDTEVPEARAEFHARWRSGVSDNEYLDATSRFLHFEVRPTGRLLIYNVFERKEFVIETGEPDSEVLLVENNQVYYRVDDSIYREEIDLRREQLTNTTLLVSAPEVRHMHWAFLGPPPPEKWEPPLFKD
tara:strand:+ start:1215 stop:2453 length:1239 start_codon:yes stop_codon:yes gene_type:complete